MRCVLLLALVLIVGGSVCADDILFIGNSFTYGAMAPVVQMNGGVPALVQEIAKAKGHDVAATAVTAGGKDWTYHLAQPATAKALAAKKWNWVVLQDYSTRPTRIGKVPEFMQDGETFTERIEQASPGAGIVLYETWARPAGPYYKSAPGNAFASPAEMMADLHDSYAKLHDDLLAKNPHVDVRVALVGTAFARVHAEYPAIVLDATDRHHATAAGYYLAALVIYETIYHDTAKGAPASFVHGLLTIPEADAVSLQQVADEVSGGLVVK